VLNIQHRVSLGVGALRRYRTAVLIFVGRCRDCGGAGDQKIAAFGSSYGGGPSRVGGLGDRGVAIRGQASLLQGNALSDGLLGRWIELRFHLRDLRLKAFQPCPSACKYNHLAIKLFPAHQIQLAEAALQQSLELAFDFAFRQRGFAAEEAGGGAAQGVEEVFGREHGKGPGNNGGQCITQCL